MRSIGSGPVHSTGSGRVRSTGSAVPTGSMRSAMAHPTGSSPLAEHSTAGQAGHSIAGAERSTAADAAVGDCADMRCRSSGTMDTMQDLLRQGTGRQAVGRTRPHTPRRIHKSIDMEKTKDNPQ